MIHQNTKPFNLNLFPLIQSRGLGPLSIPFLSRFCGYWAGTTEEDACALHQRSPASRSYGNEGGGCWTWWRKRADALRKRKKGGSIFLRFFLLTTGCFRIVKDQGFELLGLGSFEMDYMVGKDKEICNCVLENWVWSNAKVLIIVIRVAQWAIDGGSGLTRLKNEKHYFVSCCKLLKLHLPLR